MWKSFRGPCVCYFCTQGLPHPVRHDRWRENEHLQVAESLDPADLLRTRICLTCTHEERID